MFVFAMMRAPASFIRVTMVPSRSDMYPAKSADP